MSPRKAGAGRPPRLTRAEWSALCSAVSALEVQTEEGEDTDPRDAREVRAADRALRKVREHLTTPAVRR